MYTCKFSKDLLKLPHLISHYLIKNYVDKHTYNPLYHLFIIMFIRFLMFIFFNLLEETKNNLIKTPSP